MRKNDPVTRLMITDVITLDVNDPLSAARQKFEQSGVHHLPVVRGKELVGLLSWTDFLRLSFGEYGNQDARSLDAMLDHTYRLENVMIREPVTLTVAATVRDAARLLVEHRFHSLPVIDGGQLAGIVTSTDLIRYLLDQL